MNSIKELFNTNPKYSTILANIIGIILIDNLNAYEQEMIGNWIMLIAQNIITNSTSQILIESKITGNTININSKEVKSIYNPIIYNTDKLKEIINKLYPNEYVDFDILIKIIDELKSILKKID